MNREESFGAWLLKHLHLLKAQHIKSTRPFFSDYYLCPALRAAAASEHGLRLVSFSSEDGINNGREVLCLLPASTLAHLRMCVTETIEGVSGRILAETGVQSEEENTMEYSIEEVELDSFRSSEHVFGQQMYVPNRGWGAPQSFRLVHDHSRMAATFAGFSKLQSLSIFGDSSVGWDSPPWACTACAT
jgi:hypothetical protein